VNDKDGDRDHESVAVGVPVVRLVRDLGADGMTRELVADEVVVVAFQEQDARRPSITIGLVEDGRVSLDLREESAERLLEAFAAVLELIR
jgi:hypothetical protein